MGRPCPIFVHWAADDDRALPERRSPAAICGASWRPATMSRRRHRSTAAGDTIRRKALFNLKEKFFCRFFFCRCRKRDRAVQLVVDGSKGGARIANGAGKLANRERGPMVRIEAIEWNVPNILPRTVFKRTASRRRGEGGKGVGSAVRDQGRSKAHFAARRASQRARCVIFGYFRRSASVAQSLRPALRAPSM